MLCSWAQCSKCKCFTFMRLSLFSPTEHALHGKALKKNPYHVPETSCCGHCSRHWVRGALSREPRLRGCHAWPRWRLLTKDDRDRLAVSASERCSASRGLSTVMEALHDTEKNCLLTLLSSCSWQSNFPLTFSSSQLRGKSWIVSTDRPI